MFSPPFSVVEFPNPRPDDGRVRGQVPVQRRVGLRTQACRHAGAHLRVLRGHARRHPWGVLADLQN